jgi:tetrapyrrole methylase family protein / MazG family protein
MITGQEVVVVGLGPAGLGAMSHAAMEALRDARKILIRTKHHPVVAELSDRGIVFESFDALYETAESFSQLYERIAELVLAESEGGVVYAVPGHPLVGEHSVALVIEKAAARGIGVRIVPSPSFIDAMLETLHIDMDKGLKVLDALQIEQLTPSQDTPNIVYQVYDRDSASRAKLRLMDFFPDEWKVCIVRGAGTDDVQTLWIPLYELDRHDVDHLTSVYVPEVQVEN